MNQEIRGLTASEVAKRRKSIDENTSSQSITKTRKQIFAENILTLFNLLNFIIAIMLFVVGAYTNMAFIAIIILNISIGIFQELKAKKLVDELSILNRPHVKLVRDGKEISIELEEVVKDDIMVLASGNQICNDSVVLSGRMEVNESLLTGESDPVIKGVGDKLLSGSSVISGKCFAKVLHIGKENYATKLAQDVKKEKKIESELLNSMKRVTRITSILILPLGAILFLQAMFLRATDVNEAVVTVTAALLGMLPKGLVLLISVSLAMGVIRLAKLKILVQNIYSLETLAHVDVICLDKTGTITDGKMTVVDIQPLCQNTIENRFSHMICAYVEASDDNNATMQALQKYFLPDNQNTKTTKSQRKSRLQVAPSFQPIYKIPFSSQRKWGAVSFQDAGTIFIGAPEKIFKRNQIEVEKQMEKGYRVIAVGYSNQLWKDDKNLPTQISPLYIITLADNIRKNTVSTLEFFYQEGVDVKIISGDHLKTVSMIAKKAGLQRWRDAIDLSVLGKNINYDQICQEYAVFSRVTPKQKQQIVQALKRQGHHVAMTGDGVNDLLALREADCSIAVSEGSDASRQISQIVLLESDFSYLPQVVLEGRKVVNNVTRTAGVFFIKTIYSILVSILCLLINIPFPFIPIQITLVDACIEAYPSFLTIFESDTRKVNGTLLKKAIGSATPFAFIIAGVITYITLFTPLQGAQRQTVMYVLLIMISMAAVIKSCIPMSKLRFFICTTMVFGTFFAMYLFSELLEIVALSPFMLMNIGFIFIIGMEMLYLIYNFKGSTV